MTFVNRRVVQELVLALTALFAFSWAVVRAGVQSITIDEADSYFWFASRAASYIWYPHSNNHVLNSLLMWISIHVFGSSVVSIRLPALAGAAIFISTCYYLCFRLIDDFRLRFPIFVCLVYNPFIFDFMVAARGYSLADAFLLAAIAVSVWAQGTRGPSLRRGCLLASLALGLSFASNFSFALVDAAVWLAILAWAIERRGEVSVPKVLAYSSLPGLLVAILICGYPLTHWRREELWWGAHSFAQMGSSLVDSSLYQLDPRLQGSGIYEVVNLLKQGLLPVLGILCVSQVVATRLDGSWFQDDRARFVGRFAAALAGIVALTALFHGLAFRLLNLPLPLGRTGIFFVPLCTLLAGTIAAGPVRSTIARGLRDWLIIAWFGLASYFMLCLRLDYFREYQYEADMRSVYSVLARLNHAYGVNDVDMNGSFVSPLNYYRLMSRKETFPVFVTHTGDPVAGKSIYVLPGSYNQPFIEKERLDIIYRGDFSDVVIAVRRGGPIPPAKIVP